MVSSSSARSAIAVDGCNVNALPADHTYLLSTSSNSISCVSTFSASPSVSCLPLDAVRALPFIDDIHIPRSRPADAAGEPGSTKSTSAKYRLIFSPNGSRISANFMPYEVVAVESLKNDVLSPFANSEVKNFDGLAKNSLRSGLLRPSAHRYSSLIFENIHWFSAVFSRYSYVRSSPHDKKESAVASSSDSVYSLPVLILELIIVEAVLVSDYIYLQITKITQFLLLSKSGVLKKQNGCR